MQIVASLLEEVCGQLQEDSSPSLVLTSGFCTPWRAAATFAGSVKSRSWLVVQQNAVAVLTSGPK